MFISILQIAVHEVQTKTFILYPMSVRRVKPPTIPSNSQGLASVKAAGLLIWACNVLMTEFTP
jgi:hypothetical protein